MWLENDTNGVAVYFIMLCLGMAMLIAYNSFIASPDYVQKYYRFAADDATATTSMPDFWKNMETIIVIASMIPNAICQAFVVTKYGQRLSIHRRVLFSTIALLISVFIVVLLPLFKPNEHTAAGVFVSAVALSGAAAAFFQSSAFGIASMLSERFVQATMLGIGVAGSVMGILRISIKAIVGDPDFEGQQRQAFAFFGLAIGWLVLSIVMILCMPKIAYLKNRLPEYGGDLEFERKRAPSISDHPDDRLVDVGNELTPLSVGREIGNTVYVLKCIMPLMVANFLVYFMSLLVFPQLGASASDADYYPVVAIFLYNFGDTCGRFLCFFKCVHIRPAFLLPIALARFSLVPLLILSVDPKLIPGFVLPGIFMYLTGISNGFTSSLCMMYGPSVLELADSERSVAGSAMSFSLLGGCSVGSLFALLINAYVKPK